MKITKKELKNLKGESKLKNAVVEVYLNHYSEEIDLLMQDVVTYGLSGGILGEFIYYTDTVSFFNKYENEITELLKETLNSYGYNSPKELFGKKWDEEDFFCKEKLNKNLLCWFAVEEITRELLNNLNIDY